MRWLSWSSPLGGVLLALCGLGATCEDQDYSAPDHLELQDAPVFEPAVLDLVQPYRGLSSVDFRIVNTGDAEARYGVFASVSYETQDDNGDPATVETSTTRVTDAVPAGTDVAGRLFETELGLGDRLHLEFLCYDESEQSTVRCSGRLDYTVLLRQVECRVDSDCSTNEDCDTARGRCRTSGQANTGCQVSEDPPLWPVPVTVALCIGLAIGAWWRRA